MRFTVAALAIGFTLFGTHNAPASPFTAAFDPLRTEMETRRDNDFGGTLDATQNRQKAAVLKCLTLMERDSIDVRGDIITLKGVSRLLEKAYPDAEKSPHIAPPMNSRRWTLCISP